MTIAAIVLKAFLEIRQGRSAEQVICDDDLNQAFVASCRKSDQSLTDEICNTKLLNLRKAKKLSDFPTTFRKQPLPGRDRYSNCVGQAVRLMERQFDMNVDRIICNPAWRCQFDAMVQFMLPEASAFESRYKALTLRKTTRLRPEPVGQVIQATQSRIIKLEDLERQSDEIPTTPGVYLFFDENLTLYVGKADNLRRRITDHVTTWAFREMIDAIGRGDRRPAWVAFHALSLSLSSRDLTAYELELIRSRRPEHNRAGKETRERTN